MGAAGATASHSGRYTDRPEPAWTLPPAADEAQAAHGERVLTTASRVAPRRASRHVARSVAQESAMASGRASANDSSDTAARLSARPNALALHRGHRGRDPGYRRRFRVPDFAVGLKCSVRLRRADQDAHRPGHLLHDRAARRSASAASVGRIGGLALAYFLTMSTVAWRSG